MSICKRCGFVSPYYWSFEGRRYHLASSRHSSLYGSSIIRKQLFRVKLSVSTFRGKLSCTIESLKPTQVPLKYIPVVDEFQKAILKVFRDSSSESLEQLLAEDCVWKNCIKTVKGKHEIIDVFTRLVSFFVEPSIYLAETWDEKLKLSSEANLTAVLQWTISATWPIFWKPVAVYSGYSLLLCNQQGLVTYIEDFPSNPPWKILWNVLYSIRYIYFAVVADPPESVCSNRKLIQWNGRYTLWEEVSHIRWEYTSNEIESLEGVFSCLPVLPAEIFTDKFTRNETILWTTPLFFRIDVDSSPKEMTWSFPYPIRFAMSHSDMQPGVKRRQIAAGRRVASKAWFGDITRNQLYNLVEDFVKCLKMDGLLNESRSTNHLEIWWESPNCYLGFNRSGQLTLAMYRTGSYNHFVKMQPLQSRVLQTIEAHSSRVENSLREERRQLESDQMVEGSVLFYEKRETSDIVLSEARKVLAALRRNPRFAQPGVADLSNGSVYLLGSTFGGVNKSGDETRLVKNIKLLRNAFASESWPKDPRSVFKPFVDLLRTEDLPGNIISTVLSSLSRLIVYRVPTALVKLSGNLCWEEAAKAVEDIVETVSALRFGGFDSSTEEVMMSRICELMAHCVNSPEGEYLSNEALVHCIETFLRVCSPRGKKRSECSRKVAESYLRTVISHIFSRASFLVHESALEYNNTREAKPLDTFTNGNKEEQTLTKQNRSPTATEERSTYINPPHMRYNYRSLAWFLSLGARMVDPVITQNIEERLIGLQLLEIALHSAPRGSLAQMPSLRRILLRDVCRALLRCLGMLNDPSTVITSSFSTVLCLISTLGPYSTPLVQMILIRIARSFLFKEENEEGNGYNNVHPTISPVTREIALDSLAALLQKQGFLSAAYAILDCQLNESDAVQPLLEALSEETVLTEDGFLSATGYISFEIFLTCMDTLATRSFVPDDSDIDRIFGWVHRVPDISIEQMRAKKRLKRRIDELVKEFNSVGPFTSGMQVIDLIRKRDLLAQVSMSSSPKSSASPPSSPSRFSPRSPILSSFHDIDGNKAAAAFLRFTPGLNKTTIGACLGEPDEVSIKILKNYVRLFDFKNRPFTTSLRVFLESFRLPGEAQKIDRILQSFSEHFYEQNKSSTPFNSADAAHVLAFACIMLNTDQHNSSIKKKMTLEEFISNSRGINDGHDLPREFLREVYANISSVEIRMSDESGLHALTEDHWDEQLRKMGIDPESGESNNMLAFPSPAKAKEFDEDVFLIAWKPMLTATCRALGAAKDGDEVQSAIEGFLGIARLATVFRQSEPVDQVIIGLSSASKLRQGDLRLCFLSFGLSINCQMATVALYGIARQCGDCIRESGWEALLTCTMRLHILKLLPSNLEHLLFSDGEELVDLDGNPLPASNIIPYWWPGYYDSSHSAASNESPCQHSSSGSSPLSGNNTSKLSSVLSAFGGLFGFGGDDSSDEEMDGSSLQVPEFLVRTSKEEMEAEKLGKKCIGDCRIDEIFINESRFLRAESIVALMKGLVSISNQLLAPCNESTVSRQSCDKDDSQNKTTADSGKVGDSGNGNMKDWETLKVVTKDEFVSRQCGVSFCIDLMREILLRNRDRLFLLWPYCYEVVEKVLNPLTEPCPSLVRATVTLLRIVIRYGHREELSMEIFRCLNLFVKLESRSFESVSERIAAGLYHICRIHVAQIECTSSWHTLLSLLENLARCSSPANIFGFETIAFLLESKEKRINHETFAPWLDAILAYTEAPIPIAVRAVECLYILAGCLPSILSDFKDSCNYAEPFCTDDTGVSDVTSTFDNVKSKAWNEFWSPLLSAYCCLCLDDRSEVRNQAFLSFEKLELLVL
ncbi:GTP:GDP antiporter/ protein homodimerization [Galdieria sulphuraria]|uniref:GTP:GDP antiporter/ protein homodimerization n=1 Tax=Galdieria sulphuraria TaxID=130081 RepID=M2XPF6_GALSU|nr:GTP:GDP antiporter/ protein homodimerization [Galdieria sulphuraria]EME32087.1 GTP:GDP antiporter/ protein homodimerization [Galdieria sulphuraria]|eukprot:XP_005708607.1 GTP:GDP antiporter/ protein homodimerization [Galdieria sulphuraria]